MGTSPGMLENRQRGLITALGYLLLLVLGGLQGLIGSFQYGDSPTPVLAIVLDVLLFATCVLAGRGLRTYAAGILPALGWIVVSFILAMPRSNAPPAGEWYLSGGALAAAAGAAIAFFAWVRARPRPH
jgi:uncharacterized membrane protein YccC